MSEPISHYKQLTFKNPKLNPTLSSNDSEKFQDILVRNKSYSISYKSKEKSLVSLPLPLYFGTNESEFSIYRKKALRNRRLLTNSDYPEGDSDFSRKNSLPQFKIPTFTYAFGKHLSEAIAVANGSKETFIKEVVTEELPLPPPKKEEIKEPPTENHIQHKKQQQQQQQQPNGQRKQPIQQIETKKPPEKNSPEKENHIKKDIATTTVATTTEKITTATIPSKPALNQGTDVAALTTSTTTTTTTPTTTIKENTTDVKEPSLSEPSTPDLSKTATPQPKMAWSMVVQSSIPKAKSTNLPSSASPVPSTNGSAKQPSPVPQNTTSTIPLDNTLKPLGTLLLRILFDEPYLPRVIAQNKAELINPHGLLNAGSICYMNSILQLLFVCEPFTQTLNIIQHGTLASLDASTSKTPMLDACLALLESFKKSSDNGKNDVINPLAFYNSIAQLPRFRHLKWGTQEDAEEFLGHLLDGIHEECVDSIAKLPSNEVTKITSIITDKETKRNVTTAVDFIKDMETANGNGKGNDEEGWQEVGINRKIAAKRTFEVKPSPIVNLFGGQFRSVLQTPNAKKSSITLDPFMHVQLDISDSQTVDLVTAFSKLAEVEEISYGNTVAKKQNFIDKLPKVLIIHLKRFSFVTTEETIEGNDSYEIVPSGKQKKKNKELQQQEYQRQQQLLKPKSTFEGRIEKIHKPIKYGHNLTLPSSCLSHTISEVPKYKLVGVVYHHGRSTSGGHYTVDVCSPPDNKWIRIDDTQISKISSEEVIENGINGGNSQNNSKSAYILMYQKV